MRAPTQEHARGDSFADEASIVSVFAARLGERFHLLALLGEGRDSVVLLAEDRSRQQRVALKVARVAGDARTHARLLREGDALLRLAHPGLVQRVDAGLTETGEAFVATVPIEGVTLRALLTRERTLPEAWVAEAWTQLCAVLAALHATGGAHGDVTPDNCVCEGFAGLSTLPSMRLLDLGTARWEGEAELDLALGTAAYLAPEQAQQGRPSAAADQYALGVMAYELLVGVPPFRASTSSELAWQHAHEPPRPLREVAPHAPISVAMERAVSRALRKLPEERFASLPDLVAALPLSRSPSRPDDALVVSARHTTDEARHALLTRVREHWIEGVLERATDGVILVRQRLLFESPSDATGTAPSAQPVSLVDAFEQSGGALLLLGEPGHGKTVNLLRLARYLADRARLENGALGEVPVVFPLSSWPRGATRLTDFMVSQLVGHYLVPARIAARLLDERAIAPLLDGLDDVPLSDRAACVGAIHAFLAARPRQPIVVTCRSGDYETLPTRVVLGATARLTALRPADVSRQLGASSQPELLRALQGNPLLEELAQTPMLLHLMRVAFRDSAGFRGALDDRTRAVEALFEAFIESAPRRRAAGRGLPDAAVNKVAHGELRAVARLMARSGRTVLLLEELQPRWLASATDRWLYTAISRGAVALLFALSFVPAIAWSPLENAGFHTSLGFALRLAVATAFVLTVAFTLRDARSPRIADRPTPAARHVTLRALGFAAIVAACNGAAVAVFAAHPAAIGIGAQAGLVGALLLGLSRRHLHNASDDIRTVEALDWSPKHLQPRPLLALFAAAMATFVGFARFEAARTAAYVTAAVVVLGLALLGHRARALGGRLRPNVGMRRSATTAASVAIVVFVACMLLFGASYGLAYGACVGLSLGATFGLWLGGVDVLAHYTLRFLLHLRGQLAFSIVRVLDRTVEQGLLRRIGNGYMFIHAMLLQHLAGAGRR